MLILCGVSGLILGVSLVAVVLLVIEDELSSLDRQLLVAAHNSAQAFDRDPRDEIPAGLVALPESLQLTPSLVALYSADGRLRGASRSFAGDVPALESLGFDPLTPAPWSGFTFDLEHGEIPLRGVIVPMRSGGHLLFAASSRTISEDRRFLLRSLPALFVLAMLVTALISRWLGGLLARDVQRLAAVVDAVGAGDLEARVGVLGAGSRETAALAQGLDRMIERLAVLVESQRRFITEAAHELRSPLATLRGEIQLALRRERSTEEYRASLTTALEDVELLIDLAADLLTLARPTAAGEEESPGSFTLHEAVASALRMSRGPAESAGITVQVVDPEGVGGSVLRGRQPPLARALRNLIDNAVEHSAAGDRVGVVLTRRGAAIEVAIEDTGPGIEPGDREHIFTPFYRGKGRRAADEAGSGLGLALARRAVQEYGGELAHDPDYPRGARMVVTLPTDAAVLAQLAEG